MSMQSHLAELEKRHQALEEEITECLTHPAVDDLRIVELKRRKLQVKDEIERLRHNGHSQRALTVRSRATSFRSGRTRVVSEFGCYFYAP